MSRRYVTIFRKYASTLDKLWSKLLRWSNLYQQADATAREQRTLLAKGMLNKMLPANFTKVDIDIYNTQKVTTGCNHKEYEKKPYNDVPAVGIY